MLNPQSDFSSFMKSCRDRVEFALDSSLPQHEDPTQLRAAMRYSLFNGGKRVRPILAYASALAVNSKQNPELVDSIACALECLHSYSLVHDDLPAMDDDDLRRGKPTCHKAYNEATAILAGDGLQTLAFNYLANSQFSAETKVELIKCLIWGAGADGMVLGQAIDLAAVDKQITLEQLETMHRYKTGALIRASVRMGAIASAANQQQLVDLDNYAAAIGLAFQVQDDILDVTADTETLGKQQGADIAHNKPTYVSILGLEDAKQKAQDLYQDAIQSLIQFGESAEPLRLLAAYIVGRSY